MRLRTMIFEAGFGREAATILPWDLIRRPVSLKLSPGLDQVRVTCRVWVLAPTVIEWVLLWPWDSSSVNWRGWVLQVSAAPMLLTAACSSPAFSTSKT